MACYRGTGVISPRLASLVAFTSVSPFSLTSTESLVHLQSKWLICLCVSMLCLGCAGTWTVSRPFLCAWWADNICVHWSVLEVTWLCLAFPQEDTSLPCILHSPVKVMKEWMPDNWTVHSKEQPKKGFYRQLGSLKLMHSTDREEKNAAKCSWWDLKIWKKLKKNMLAIQFIFLYHNIDFFNHCRHGWFQWRSRVLGWLCLMI